MKTGSLVITMSTYSAHKGDSGADVGLDPAHAHAHAHTHAIHIMAGHLKLEWVGGHQGEVGVGHPQPEGVGAEEEVVVEHPEP